ncbi:hypothetical protein Goari_024767 [Gossypium aridum]|uniref:Uncharacterized protein n=1 Tax=Gossypium aridum TaxID=34290 RepID=A0A7J8X749_GOSAI|nr:hypothetical protein [Gossypium aridum]
MESFVEEVLLGSLVRAGMSCL